MSVTCSHLGNNDLHTSIHTYMHAYMWERANGKENMEEHLGTLFERYKIILCTISEMFT